MQTLPEFFCGKFPHKNPATYFNYRNCIIKLYRERPSAYLSATECRKKLPGDVCSIIRLHAFLEQWGLINFHVESHLKPAKIQLGGSGNVSHELIDVVSKGFLKLGDAHRLNFIYKQQERYRQGLLDQRAQHFGDKDAKAEGMPSDGIIPIQAAP
jgi:hypothetical protein